MTEQRSGQPCATDDLVLLGELLDLAQDLVIVRDAEERIVYWNAAAERIFGWSRAEARGRSAHELLGAAFRESRDRAMRELAQRGSWGGDLVYQTRDGREIIVASRWSARRGDGDRVELVLQVGRDVTEERRLAREHLEITAQLETQAAELEQQAEEAQTLAEELEQTNDELSRSSEMLEAALADARRAEEAVRASADRATRLLVFATALADAMTVDEVADVVLREGMAAVGADAGSLALLRHRPDGTAELEIVRTSGYPVALAERFRAFPLRAGRPLSDALLARVPVVFGSSAEWRRRYPEMANRAEELRYEAMVNIPVIEHGRAIAGLSYSFREPRTFDDATRTFLATVGEQCGLALGRVRAFDGERRAREASAFLAQVSELLAESLDYEATLRALAQAVVPRLADWCAVDMIVDPVQREWPPRVERLAVVHQDPAKVQWARELAERSKPDWNAATGLPRVLREGVTEFYPSISDEMLVAAARTPEELALLREIGLSALVIVPLIARGLPLGALTLCTTESGRRYDDADRTLAEELARRAAVAVDNARLFAEAERDRAIAEQANRAKAEFLATMSHELRTPLNAIAGYSELLQLGIHGPLSPSQIDAIQRIQRSQRVLLSLVEDVLGFARLESGRVEYHMTDVPLDESLASLEAIVSPLLEGRPVRYVCGSAGDGITAWADREKLEQILLNLVTNAIKFTDRGSVRVSCDVEEDDVRIHVRDTGIGVPADKLEAIFEPFVQAERALTRRAQGSGLGLAISRDLARAMGGDVTAKSTPGKGSTFTLRLRRTAPG